MSYIYSVTDEFQSALASLPFWLQEETLDELEGLLGEPHRLVVRAGDDLAVHDFTRNTGDVFHYVFLTIRPDHASEILVLTRLGYVERGLPAGS